MRRWKRWRLVAIGFIGTSDHAQRSRIAARGWNADPNTPRFWTQWGAERAGKYFSLSLNVAMLPAHERELEGLHAEPAERP